MPNFVKSSRLNYLASELDQISHDLEEMMQATFEGFIRNDELLLNGTINLGKRIDGEVKAITQRILANKMIEGSMGEHAVLLLSVLNNFEHIKFYVEKIGQNTLKKIRGGYLFSNKAVNEISFLFSTSRNSIRHIHDILLTDNPVLRTYLEEQLSAARVKTQEFVIEHEDRLSNGVCLPKSTSIYLGLMDSLRDILWHLAEVAKLLDDSAKETSEGAV